MTCFMSCCHAVVIQYSPFELIYCLVVLLFYFLAVFLILLFVLLCVVLLMCRYASLYFLAAIEPGDNELITLEVIHRFVELLDKYFGNVSAYMVRVHVCACVHACMSVFSSC